MTRTDLEVARAFFDAYNARDIDAIEELLDPHAEITTLSARAGLATNWGSRAATRRYFEQLDESWDELQVQIDEYREVGAAVVATGQMRGVGKASHAEVVETIATVLLVRGSRIVLVDTYGDPEAAVRAATALPAEARASHTA